MLKSKHVIPAIELLGIGSLTAVGLAVGGPIGAGVMGAIGLNLSSNLLEGAKAQLKEKWLNSDSGALNHDIQQALVRAFVKAVHRMESEYSETADGTQLPRNRQAIRRLCKSLGDAATEMFMKADDLAISRDDLHSFLGQEPNDAYNQLWDQIGQSELFEDSPDGFKTFLRNRLFDQVVAKFGEELKLDNKESNRAWRAFERLLLEETIAGVEDVKASQAVLADAVEAGFAEFQKLKGVAVVAGRIDRTTTRTDRTATRIEVQLADVASDVKSLLAKSDEAEPPKLPEEISPVFDRGWRSRDSGDHESAHAAFDEALEWGQDNSDNLTIATSKYAKACLLNERRVEPDHAKSLLLESLRGFLDVRSVGGVSRALHQLGTFELQRRNYDEARAYLRQSADVAKASNDREGTAAALHQLGELEFQLGRSDRALDTFDEALTSAHAVCQDPTAKERDKKQALDVIGACYHHKGLVFDSNGNYQQAETNFRRAADAYRETGVEINVGRPLFLLARLKFRESDFDAADQYISEATQIFLKCDELEWAARCVDMKGRALFTVSQRPELLRDAQQVREMANLCFQNAANLTRDPRQKAGCLTKLGRLHLEAGELEKAREYLDRSYKLAETERLPHELAIATRNLAGLAQSVGRAEEAARLFSKAIETLKAMLPSEPVPLQQAGLMGEIGAFYEEMGEHGEALTYYQKAKRIYADLADVGGIANTMGCIARMKRFLGNEAEEFAIYREMKRLVDGTPYYDLIAGAACNLGVSEMELGRFEAARQLFEEARLLSVKHFLPILETVEKNLQRLDKEAPNRTAPDLRFEELVHELFDLTNAFPEFKRELLSFWMLARDEILQANYRTMAGTKLMLCVDEVGEFLNVAANLHPYADLCLQIVSSEYPGVASVRIPFPLDKDRFFEQGPLASYCRLTDESIQSEATGNEGIALETMLLQLPQQAEELLHSRTASELIASKVFFLPYEKHRSPDKLYSDLTFARHVGLVPVYAGVIPNSDDVDLLTTATFALPLLDTETPTSTRRLVRRVKRVLSQLATLCTEQVDPTVADLLDCSEELTDETAGDDAMQLQISVFEVPTEKVKTPYVALGLTDA